MRKCGSCGSLSLGEGEFCGRCGTPLTAAPTASPSPSPPASPLPSPSPSPPSSPPSLFGRLTIPSPVPAPALASASGAPPPPDPNFRTAWQPVSLAEPVTPTRPARTTRAGVVAVAVAVAFALGFGAMHLHSDPLPKGTSAYVAGGGMTFTSPDGGFQVLLPDTPVVDRRTATFSDVTATLSIADVKTDDYEVAAMSIAFARPIDQARVNEALDAALTGGISGVDGKLVQKNATTHDRLPAIEGRFKAADGYRAHILVVAASSELIMLVAHAKTGTDRLYQALEASLIVR